MIGIAPKIPWIVLVGGDGILRFSIKFDFLFLISAYLNTCTWAYIVTGMYSKVCHFWADKETERAACHVDGTRSQCGCDCAKIGDDFFDGALQRYYSFLQNQAFDRKREKHEGEVLQWQGLNIKTGKV